MFLYSSTTYIIPCTGVRIKYHTCTLYLIRQIRTSISALVAQVRCTGSLHQGAIHFSYPVVLYISIMYLVHFFVRCTALNIVKTLILFSTCNLSFNDAHIPGGEKLRTPAYYYLTHLLQVSYGSR